MTNQYKKYKSESKTDRGKKGNGRNKEERRNG